MRLSQGACARAAKDAATLEATWVSAAKQLLTREGAEQYSHTDFTRTSPAPTRPQSAARANWARPLGQPFARWGAVLVLWRCIVAMALCSCRAVCDCRLGGAQVLRPLNRAWFCFGPAPGADRAADRVGLMFYAIFTSFALIFRRFARKPLGGDRRPMVPVAGLRARASNDLKNQF
jgi:hypothetical protein